MWAILSALPVRRLSMHTTSQPLSRRRSQRCEPMKPAPPVTSTRTRTPSGRDHGLAPDRVVLEAEPAHAFGLPDIAAVEDDPPAENAPQPLEVDELELVPLGDEQHRVGILGRLVGGGAVGHAGGQQPAGFDGGTGIARPY